MIISHVALSQNPATKHLNHKMTLGGSFSNLLIINLEIYLERT